MWEKENFLVVFLGLVGGAVASLVSWGAIVVTSKAQIEHLKDENQELKSRIKSLEDKVEHNYDKILEKLDVEKEERSKLNDNLSTTTHKVVTLLNVLTNLEIIKNIK